MLWTASLTMPRWPALGSTSGELQVYHSISIIYFETMLIITGGFCVTYFQTQWVAKSGAAVTFGVQGAIVGAFTFFVIATQIFGKKWRVSHAPPAAEN
jgi:hypothetical protein